MIYNDFLKKLCFADTWLSIGVLIYYLKDAVLLLFSGVFISYLQTTSGGVVFSNLQ